MSWGNTRAYPARKEPIGAKPISDTPYSGSVAELRKALEKDGSVKAVCKPKRSTRHLALQSVRAVSTRPKGPASPLKLRSDKAQPSDEQATKVAGASSAKADYATIIVPAEPKPEVERPTEYRSLEDTLKEWRLAHGMDEFGNRITAKPTAGR